jgi:class 3 adenylate cyclase
VVDLIPGELEALRWVHLGLYRVRDFPGWTDIFQLCAPFMQRDFPSLSTLDTGLPPVCMIVFLDADGLLREVDKLSQEDENALFAMFAELFANNFARARGQYLQFQGDGCLALFADPQAALQFARDARVGSRMLGYEMRGVLHLGHVEFAYGAPYGRSLRVAGTMIRHGARGAITLSASAATVIEPANDLVVYRPPA